jgi:hypothetical protein
MRLYPEAPKGSYLEKNLYFGTEQGAKPGEEHYQEPWVHADSRANRTRVAQGMDFSRVDGMGGMKQALGLGGLGQILQSAFPHYRDQVSTPQSTLPKVLQHFAASSLQPEPTAEASLSNDLQDEGASRQADQSRIRSRLRTEPGVGEWRGTRMNALGELEPVMGKYGFGISDTMGQWASPPGMRHLAGASVVATQDGQLAMGVGGLAGLGSSAGAVLYANAQTAQIKQALNAGDVITAISVAAGTPWTTKPTAAQVDSLINSPATGPQILQKLWDAVNSSTTGQPNAGYRSPLPNTLPAATLQANLQSYLSQIPNQTATAAPVKAAAANTINVVNDAVTNALASAVLPAGVSVPAPTPSAATSASATAATPLTTPPAAVSPLVTGSAVTPGTGYQVIGTDNLGRPAYGLIAGYSTATAMPPAGLVAIGSDTSGNLVYGTSGGTYTPGVAGSSPALTGAVPAGTGYTVIGTDNLGRPVYGLVTGYSTANAAPPIGLTAIGTDANGNLVYGTAGGVYTNTAQAAAQAAALQAQAAGATPSWLSSGGSTDTSGGGGSPSWLASSGQTAAAAAATALPAAPTPTGLSAPITLPLLGTVPTYVPLALAAAGAFFFYEKKKKETAPKTNPRRTKKRKAKR